MKNLTQRNFAFSGFSLKIILFTFILFFILPISRNFAQSTDPNKNTAPLEPARYQHPVSQSTDPNENTAPLEPARYQHPVSQSTDPIEKTESKQDEYHYDPAGKRDPFYSKLWKEEKAITLSKKAVGLQKYELTEISLVGIVWGALGRKGVIETPEGKSYMIKTGTPIGKRGGVIKAITEKEVVIQEFATDYLGNRVEKISLLKIKHEKKGE